MYASCPYVYKWSRKIRPADTPDVEPKHRQLLIVHQAGLNSSSTTVRQGQEEDRELRGSHYGATGLRSGGSQQSPCFDNLYFPSWLCM